MSTALAITLFFGVLSIWVPQLWAWSLFQTVIFLLAGIRLLRKYPLRFTFAYLPLVFTPLWPLLQLAFGKTVDRGTTWMASLSWFTFVAVFFVACESLSELRTRQQFLRVVSVGGCLVALLSTAQNYSAGGSIFWLFPSGFTQNVLGPFVNRNEYSAWMELLLPVALYLAISDFRHRMVHATCAAVMLSSVIASGSRMGSALVVAETAAFAIVLVVRTGLSRKILFIRSLQFAAIAAMAVGIAGSQTLQTRLRDMGPEPLRVDAWRASVKMIADRPWMGSGIGTWSTMYPRYAAIDTGEFMNQAHNDWLQWAAEGGLPFLLLMVMFTACVFRPAIRSLFGVGLLAFLLHACVDYPMQQRPALAAWFFAMAGAVMAAERKPDPLRSGKL